MISMAIAHRAHGADDGCELAKPRLRPSGLLSSLPILPAISVVVVALGLAGCARNPVRSELNPVHSDLKRVQRQVRVTSVRPHSPARVRVDTRKPAETQQPAELRVRRPDAALLVPQPAPNCEFMRADVKAVDPGEWARLKAEFERQCYQAAEKAARDRLSQLQASSTCEVERVPEQRPAQ
jgi:hypothetical protein